MLAINKLNSKQLYIKITSVVCTLVMLLMPMAAQAILPADKVAVDQDSVYYDPTFCAPDNPGAAGITPGPIYLVGDSVLAGVSQKLSTVLAQNGWTPKVNGLVSRKLNGTPPDPDGLGAVDADKDFIATAKVVVVELGTNPSSGFAEAIPAMITKIRSYNPQVQIMWVDTAESARPAFAATIAGTNAAIYAQSTALNYKVIPWYQKVFGGSFDAKTVNPTAVDTNGYIVTTDGVNVHPTAKGVDAYTDMIISALAGAGGGALPVTVPEPYRTIFTKAAQKFGTDVALVATIFWKEHGGFPPPPPPYGTGPNFASSNQGAQGPFQFLSGTWAAHGQDGNGDGVKDIQNLEDAAFGAAELLKSMGGAAGAPPGTIQAPMEPGTIVRVMLAYNWGPGAVEDAYRAGRRSFNDITSSQAKDYITKGMPFYLALVGGLALGTVSTSSTCSTGVGAGAIPGAGGFEISGANAMVYYNQGDAQWADLPYGKGSGNTIRKCGCGPTSMAMIIATLTGDGSVTPPVVANYVMQSEPQDISQDCGSQQSVGLVAQHWGLHVTGLGRNLTAAAAVLQQGGLVLLNVANTSGGPIHLSGSGHFVVMRKVSDDGQSIYIANPGYPADNNVAFKVSEVAGQLQIGSNPLYGVTR